ncbi:hypothetical protein V1477_006982 [Vespula maculifrons]|uniref:Uncharacterized protein n=1 Tax=Vespula maculifrons TaxID=7453 RepID=A0ABD2CH82_VESMC
MTSSLLNTSPADVVLPDNRLTIFIHEKVVKEKKEKEEKKDEEEEEEEEKEKDRIMMMVIVWISDSSSQSERTFKGPWKTSKTCRNANPDLAIRSMPIFQYVSDDPMFFMSNDRGGVGGG